MSLAVFRYTRRLKQPVAEATRAGSSSPPLRCSTTKPAEPMSFCAPVTARFEPLDGNEKEKIMRNAIERIKNGLAKANLNISKIMASTMAVALLSSGLLTSAEASSDALDASFGLGGKVVTDFFGKADSAVRMVIQPDGR